MPFLISVIEDGISIVSNDEQSSKAFSPIDFTEEGIVICVNDEHCLNALLPILVIEFGISLFSKIIGNLANSPSLILFLE